VEKGKIFNIKGDEGKRSSLEFPNFALRVSDLIAKYSMLLE
jgi:hypothetical protein